MTNEKDKWNLIGFFWTWVLREIMYFFGGRFRLARSGTFVNFAYVDKKGRLLFQMNLPPEVVFDANKKANWIDNSRDKEGK